MVIIPVRTRTIKTKIMRTRTYRKRPVKALILEFYVPVVLTIRVFVIDSCQ